MKINNRVRWWHQSRGRTRNYSGWVTAVVPKGYTPDIQALRSLGYKTGSIKHAEEHAGRDHESYLVQDENSNVYWPIVTRLS